MKQIMEPITDKLKEEGNFIQEIITSEDEHTFLEEILSFHGEEDQFSDNDVQEHIEFVMPINDKFSHPTLVVTIIFCVTHLKWFHLR